MKKTILITGSTDGIGKLAAIKLAKDGHAIYLHGRSLEKLEKVIAETKSLSKNDAIKGFVADFSDLEAVRQMAEKINKEISCIDVLINNAGVFNSSKTHNKEGFDMRMVVNYFAPYLLTEALIPLLNKAAAPRLINLGSAAQNPVTKDALSRNTQIPTHPAYGQSKLALTMWSFYLAQTLSKITVIPVNPGSLLDTNMVREAFGKFWSSADKGANILYDLAVLPAYEGITGKYFDNDKGAQIGAFGDAHRDAYDDEKVGELVAFTREMMGV